MKAHISISEQDDILTESEVVRLTGKVRYHAQARVLDDLGIKYTPRPGRPRGLIVMRAHRDAALGLRKTTRIVEDLATPNFAALD